MLLDFLWPDIFISGGMFCHHLTHDKELFLEKMKKLKKNDEREDDKERTIFCACNGRSCSSGWRYGQSVRQSGGRNDNYGGANNAQYGQTSRPEYTRPYANSYVYGVDGASRQADEVRYNLHSATTLIVLPIWAS